MRSGSTGSRQRGGAAVAHSQALDKPDLPAVERDRSPVSKSDPRFEWGWLLIVVLTPLLINPWGTQVFDLVKLSFLRSTVILMAALWLARLFAYRPGHRLFSALSWRDPRPYAAVLALLLVASTVASPDVNLSLWGSTSRQEGLYSALCYLVLFALVAAELRSARQAERLLMAVAFGSLPVVAYGLLQWMGLDPIPWQFSDKSRVLSTLGRSNFVGSYLVMSVPLAIGALALSRRRPTQAVLALGLISSLAILVLTRARAAWLALAVAALVILVLVLSRRVPKRLRRIALLSVGMLLVFAAAFVVTAALSGRLTPAILHLSGLSGSPAGRLAIWQAALGLVAERPLLGFGPDSFVLAFYHVDPPQLLFYQGRGMVTDRAHNILLQQAVTAGIPGLIVYLALAATLIATLFRAFSAASGRLRILLGAIFVSIVGHFVDLLFGFDVASTAAIFWPLAGAAVALTRLTDAPTGLADGTDFPGVAYRRHSKTAGLEPHIDGSGSPSLTPPIETPVRSVGDSPGRCRDACPPPVTPDPQRHPATAQSANPLRRLAPLAVVLLAIALMLGTNVAPLVADTYAGLALRPQTALATRLSDAQRAIALWPPEPSYRAELAWLYRLQAGEAADPRPSLDLAEQFQAEAVALRPLDPLSWATLADVRGYRAARLNDPAALEAAEDAIQRAIALAPDKATLHAAAGALALAGGRNSLAVKRLEKSVGIDPTDARAWRLLAEAYRLTGGKTESAIATANAERQEAADRAKRGHHTN